MDPTTIQAYASIGALGVVVSGAILLYFGKAISDVTIPKYDKLSIYITGALFSIFFIYLPATILYSLHAKGWLPLIPEAYLTWVLGLEFVLALLLHYGMQWKQMQQFDLDKKIKLEMRSRTEKVLKKNPALEKLVRRNGSDPIDPSPAINIVEGLGSRAFTFMSALVVTYVTFSVIVTKETHLLLIGVLLAFLSLTIIALNYGFASNKYFPSTILLSDGSTLEGRIIKHGEFIMIITDDKKIFVNSEDIRRIEQAKLMRKQPPNKVYLLRAPKATRKSLKRTPPRKSTKLKEPASLKIND